MFLPSPSLRFFCELGSNTSQATICSVGHYCPEGSSTPSPCPQGTYTNTQGLVNITQCTDCDPGMYCNDTGLSSPVAQCDPGFYCPGGADVSSPVSTPCPIGLHCPMGSALPQPCPAGTYANFSQASDCQICPEGYYCVPEEVIEGQCLRKLPKP
ncbi:multiple epidermal growth factor-like domains protein 11 [Plakobranchus ocellatus]|uniref:Multiple epidermal growth factor-like domains protein 11 n=1 Tax=Plakobranchus ocellatus TaxID=259542 RepID=A0AAV4DZA2_9GAST|nr:multiple epidermal growth factor-like domains protein 11 [Plakobranchus ocellatus]